MSAPDLGAWMRRAQEMQGKLAELQRELARRTVQGTAGAGLVTATVTGELRVLSIAIDPKLFAEGDRALLQDLAAAAVNAAIQNAQRLVQEEMQRAAGALALPPPGASG